jgi:hemin uptake protein HemP
VDSLLRRNTLIAGSIRDRTESAVMDRPPHEPQLASPWSVEHAPGASSAARANPIPSEQLLQGRRLVEISHNGEVYRLQSTRLGKLILTK